MLRSYATIVLCLMLYNSGAFAQVKAQKIIKWGGNTVGKSIVEMSNGQYALFGGSLSIRLSVLASDLSLVEDRYYPWADVRGNGGGGDKTMDGGYVFTGLTVNFGPGWEDIALIKTDNGGNIDWAMAYGGSAGGEEGMYVEQTSDSGFVVCGITLSYGAGMLDAYVIRTDASGNLQWARSYGGTNNDIAYCVKETTDGGFIITGYTASFGSGSQAWLIKTDASGDTLWTRTYGGVVGHTLKGFAFNLEEFGLNQLDLYDGQEELKEKVREQEETIEKLEKRLDELEDKMADRN